MASAELLKMTHTVDTKVTGVDDRVKAVDDKLQDVRKDVSGDVQDVGDKVQGVDDKLDQVNRSLFLTPAHRSEYSNSFTGNQLRDSLLRWLSPPDPSINHNIASKAHHNGTAQWFFQGSMFSLWKSTDSFLWIHGKRPLPFAFSVQRPLIISCFCSGFREKCPLVCPSTRSALMKLTLSIQFLDHTRYHGFGRHPEGLDSLLLF